MEINLSNKISSYLQEQSKAASLAAFRVLFGVIMFISMIRFWYHGWIEKLYLEPTFHFKYCGFEFVQVLGSYTYLLFAVCGLSALFVALGLKYRLAIVTFFLSFAYIELMDKTSYLNHYYFVSVLSFILVLLPAHCSYSLDAFYNEKLRAQYIPRWNVDIIKLMLAVVYISAGLAKLNYDWMVRAMPLALWLPTKFDLPFLGSVMHEKWMHYFFSWAGAFYDLFIVFFLMWNRTRVLAFVAVVVFHLLTRVLFPIGMFPYIMIASTLIFFSENFHQNFLEKFWGLLGMSKVTFKNGQKYSFGSAEKLVLPLLAAFMCLQILIPFRNVLYPGNVFWNERGYRFSWKVMLMEKTGYANFKIVDGETKKQFYVQNEDFLKPQQQKEMSTQPDFVLEYGQYLGQHFASQGHKNVEVYVESYAALNGRRNQKFIQEDIDLMTLDCRTIYAHINPLKD